MQGNEFSTDVLVVGGGLAGLLAAIKAKEQGAGVAIVDKATVGKCGQSAFAAGDIDCLPPGEDSEAILKGHLAMHVLASRQLMEECLQHSYERVLELDRWGCSLEKDEKGKFMIKTGPGGIRRVVFVAAKLMWKIRTVAAQKGVRVINKVYISDLLTNEGRAAGAVGFDIITGEPRIFKAKNTVLAGASYGLKANNFQGVGMLAGDSLAIAYRAGAGVYNMEFPRGNNGHRLYNTVGMARFIGSFGGRFVNGQGEYFMERYNPGASVPDSLSYDRLWIACAKEVQAGRGPIYFDLTKMSPEDYALSRKLLPHLFRTLDSAGVDIRKEKMPWMPVGYRGYGGVDHDHDFKVAGLDGLFVAGDNTGAASTLMWALFSGAKAGTVAGRNALEVREPAVDKEQGERLLRDAFAPLERKKRLSADEVIFRVQEVIVPYDVLILRTEDRLKKALERVERIRDQDLPRISAPDGHELMKANEARSLTLTSEMLLRAAIMRKESRNFHYREDYPERDDKNWFRRIVFTREKEQMKLSTKPVLA